MERQLDNTARDRIAGTHQQRIPAILDVCDRISLGSDQSMQTDFIGQGNLWIDLVDETAAVKLTQYLIDEALANTAPGQLAIVGFDSELTGVFAPFASLSSGDQGALRLITDISELATELTLIRQQIQAVQNVIQGRARSLIDFRREVGRPVEGYELVVLMLDMGTVDLKLLNQLSLLMKSGPAAGVSFLIVSTTLVTIPTRGNREVELTVEDIAPNITVLETDGRTVGVAGSAPKAPLPAKTAGVLLDHAAHYATRATTATLPVVRFDDLHDLHDVWSHKSTDGVTFALGKYGVEDVWVTIGDETNQRHNALITGAVGQGKSNLISVIVHSLCLRYPPSELELYLLDFKEGVTFKAFSNIDKDDFLPHARTLGLESDVEFGISVLESLFAEYKRRMGILKEAGVRSVKELREADPTVALPRIVTIIDEFQMMFGDDHQTGTRVADLLERSVRLFRAAGIHFILSSQSLSGNQALSQKFDSLFSQVPIRIALKNTEEGSRQTLGINNPAAARIRPREAIVNLDFGAVSQNHKTVIAYADETILAPLRVSWWERARRDGARAGGLEGDRTGSRPIEPPFVFESERHVSVGQATDAISRLRREAGRPTALLGSLISIDGTKLAIPMPAEPGRNIAIIGTPDADCNHAAGMIQSAALSLALQHPRGDARFVLCDFTGAGPIERAYPHFAQAMAQAGFYVEEVAPDAFESTVGELADEPTADEAVYVLGLGMDRWAYEADPFGQGSALKRLVEDGPAKGRHVIGWWTKASRFNQQVAGLGGSDAFNTKVFLRVDERTVQSLTSPFVRWTAQRNRALANDEVELDRETLFIPFAPIGGDDASALRTVGL